MAADDTDFRLITCEACEGEGRFYNTWDSPEWYLEDCPCCEGTGREIIRVQPISMEDLDIIAGEGVGVSART